jgi:hypothetical protein
MRGAQPAQRKPAAKRLGASMGWVERMAMAAASVADAHHAGRERLRIPLVASTRSRRVLGVIDDAGA